MSNVFTLASLREEADRKFAPLKIEDGRESFVLRNLMRVNEDDRNAVVDALKAIEEHEGESASTDDLVAVADAVSLVIRTVVADGKGDRLVAKLDGDLAVAMSLLERWTEATQPGEAQDSPA